MNLKKLLFIFPLMMVFFVSAAAYSPSVEVSVWPDFCIPDEPYLQEYPGDSSVRMPAVRTSMGISAGVYPLGITFNGFSFRLGISYRSVSGSLAYGISRLKGYGGPGLSFSAQYRFSKYTVDFDAGFYIMRFSHTDDLFPAITSGISAGYIFVLWKKLILIASAGVSVQFKTDCVSLCPSIGGKLSWGD